MSDYRLSIVNLMHVLVYIIDFEQKLPALRFHKIFKVESNCLKLPNDKDILFLYIIECFVLPCSALSVAVLFGHPGFKQSVGTFHRKTVSSASLILI